MKNFARVRPILLITILLTSIAACRSGPAALIAPPAPPPAPVAVVEAPPVVVAPVPPPPPARGEQPDPSAGARTPVLYKLWYATNRKPMRVKDEVVDYAWTWDNGTVHYGTIYAEIPEDFLEKMNRRGFIAWISPASEAKLRLTKPVEIAASEFITQMKLGLSNDDKQEEQVLVYLHGFNTSFKEAAQRAASIGYQLKMPTTAFFSWPSQSGLKTYIANRDAADISTDDIADFLIKLYAETGAKKIHLIAHSMGNHVLLNAIKTSRMHEAFKGGMRFGQIILAAPDVDTDRFIYEAGKFANIADRVSLYVSDGDKALRASVLLAPKHPRAGLRPPIVVVKNIDTVDVSSTNLTFLGHAFVSQELAVLNDMHSLILYNTPPEKRMHILKKDNYWQLK